MRFGILGSIVIVSVTAGVLSAPSWARTRHATGGSGGGPPELDVRGSCSDAQKFSSGDSKGTAFKGCMQDETNAKNELAKRWSTFKPKDRSNCVEQARFPSPSYVEVLTCLEMDAGTIRTSPQTETKPDPQIGGPVAPGLTAPPVVPK